MKYITAFSLIVGLTLFSCSKLTHIPFDADFHSSISVPHETVPGITDSISAVVTTDLDSIMKKNNTRPDLVQSAKLSALTLTITTPPGQTFAFLKDIRVFVVTKQGYIEVASKHNIASAGSTLEMDLDNIELKQYLVTNTIPLKVVATTANATTVDMTIYMNMKVHFEANLLAIL